MSLPAYEVAFRGMVYCVVCGVEQRRDDPVKKWPTCCNAAVIKGCCPEELATKLKQLRTT